MKIEFALNGDPQIVEIETHTTLVELLQDRFGLFGARESCGQGLCGCCTVLVDGRAVSACLYLAAFADGTRVETIERDVSLDDVQQAFIDTGAFQCGFCTPGFVLMTRQLLETYPEPTDEQIGHYLSGNLCRCAAYPEIAAAVHLASRGRKARRGR
jgi:aerobic carbon-monoxide dehydrogenase small subunit